MEGIIFTPVNVLFQLAFSPSSLFFVLILIINLGCLILILKQSIRPFILNVLVFYLLTLIYWGLTGLFESLSINSVSAGYWFILSSLSFGILPTALLFFTFFYVKKTEIVKNAIFQILVTLPSIIFLQLSLSTDFLTNPLSPNYKQTIFGWNNPVTPFFTAFYCIWLLIVIGISVFELIKFYKNPLNIDLSKQTFRIILGLVIGGVLIIGTEIILSLVQISEFPGYIALFYTFVGTVLTYGLVRDVKYTVEPDFIVSQIIDTLSEAVIVINSTDHKIEYVNKTLLNLLKYRQSDLLGADISIILQKDNQRVLNHFDTEVSNVRPEPLETTFVTSEGNSMVFTVFSTPFISKDKSTKSIVIMATDISELKELLNISLEQQKLEAIIESVSDGVIVLNTIGEIEIINSAAQKILNTMTPDVKEKNLKDFATFIYQGNILDINEYLKKEDLLKPIIFKEAQVIIKNLNIPANITITKLILNQNVDLGLIITIYDLTKEKELAVKKLDFVTVTAHELRTPLTVLRGYAFVWLKDHQNIKNESGKLMEQIKMSADKLITLVDNLLKVTKIE